MRFARVPSSECLGCLCLCVFVCKCGEKLCDENVVEKMLKPKKTRESCLESFGATQLEYKVSSKIHYGIDLPHTRTNIHTHLEVFAA